MWAISLPKQQQQQPCCIIWGYSSIHFLTILAIFTNVYKLNVIIINAWGVAGLKFRELLKTDVTWLVLENLRSKEF